MTSTVPVHIPEQHAPLLTEDRDASTRQYLLIRHGQAQRFGPRTAMDAELTPRGEAQARWLAQRLAGSGVDRVVCSEFQRARSTAQPLLKRLQGIQAQIQPALNEIHGVDDWRSLDQVQVRRLNHTRLYQPHRPVERGESLHTFHTRVWRGWEELQTSSARRTAVFTHGGVIAALVAQLLGLDPNKPSSTLLVVGNASVTEVWVTENLGDPELPPVIQQIRFVNDQRHLPEGQCSLY